MKGKKTYTGIAVLAIPQIARIFGVEIGEAESMELVEVVMTLAGMVMAIYGRYKAVI